MCEDERGSVWTQIEGPPVEFRAENGSEGRGYSINIGPFVHPGTYTFRVTVPQDWRDGEGHQVPVAGVVFRDVSFEVR